MDESGYKEEVNEVIERFMKKHQSSPNSDIEEVSLQDGGVCT
ncbi:MAG: hypothetical protein U0X86_000503 [Wolbachia endosymbiont of Xenopsylla cheopis]